MRQQHLVAEGHVAIVEGMQGQEVGRQEPLVGGIAHRVIGGHNMRVMGTIERDITEEGAVPMLLQEPHRLIGKRRAGMFGGPLRLR